MSEIYVVIRKYNHTRPFQHSIQHSIQPVLEWNAGIAHIEGVFSYYPSHYTRNVGFQIYGPYELQGTLPTFDFNKYAQTNQTLPPNYPPFDFDRMY